MTPPQRQSRPQGAHPEPAHIKINATSEDTPTVTEAWDNSDWFWRSVALTAMGWLVDLGQPFTAYDLTELGVPSPDSPGRWGGLFRAAYTSGLIKPVGFTQSRRPSRSGGVCRVWVGA